MDIRQTICPSRHKGGIGGGLGGHKFKTLGKLSNWHQRWFTSEDSSGNGHGLNTSRPSITRVACGGGGMGVTNSKVWGRCQTAGPIGTNFGSRLRIHLGMDIRLKTSHPSIPQGAFWGVLWGHKFKSLGKLSNGCTDWHQIWYTYPDSPGNGYTPNKLSLETQGGGALVVF